MFEAITFNAMKQTLDERVSARTKTFAILLVKPNKSQVSEEILNNISYFHHRSEDKLDIFMPGYGAYWGDTIPDSKNICKIDNVDWSFSNKLFVDFINTIETVSTMKYYGGCELILLDYVSKDISFRNVVRIKLDKALKDGAIESVEGFIETIISKFIKSTSAYHLSDLLTLTELGRSIADELKKKFAPLRIFVRSEHYTIKNYNLKNRFDDLIGGIRVRR